MRGEHVLAWMERHSGPDSIWFIKRLAANDTGATGAHQKGPYFPSPLVFHLFPSLKKTQSPNPRAIIPTVVASHDSEPIKINVIWYNQKTRRECRLTCWGGLEGGVTDPESTGSIALFVFRKPAQGDAEYCEVWVCNAAEEALVEGNLGVIEPGISQTFHGRPGEPVADEPSTDAHCSLIEASMPAAWRTSFPDARELVDFSIGRRPLPGNSADDRLLQRRACEYEAFRSLEQYSVLPRVKQGFASIDEFIHFGNAVLNRRKARAGRSLELQLSRIFDEERVNYSHEEISEAHKRPDFLFPSASRYRSGGSPVWMLGVKTTCKDRWRQILNEADRLPVKHLATLQEGVSLNQYAEMKAAGVRLVVPKALHLRYPGPIRHELLTVESFIGLVKGLPL